MSDDFIYIYLKEKFDIGDREIAKITNEILEEEWSGGCPSMNKEIAGILRNEGFVIPEIIEVTDCENIIRTILEYHGIAKVNGCVECWNMRYHMFCELIHRNNKYWEVN